MAWNAVIASHAQAGERADDALRRFSQMQEEGCLPGRFTHANLLSGFTSCEDAMQGKRVHAALAGSVLEADVVIVNALVTMYARCEKKAESARMVFDGAPMLDVVAWNGMLASYEDKLEALQLLGRMLLAGIMPDRVTYVSLVSVCASQSFAAEGKRMHARIVASKYSGDVNLGNALVSMYAKCGSARDASIVFENMQVRDVVSWNAIITAYALCGSGHEAIGLYDRMMRFATPNKVTYLVVLVACSHAGLLEEAFFFFLFCSPIHGLEPAEEHYNCIVELLGRSGLVEESERIIDLLPLLRNSALAWATLLGFCRVHCDEDCGERAASNALHLEPGNSSLYVLLSNIYASSSSP
jgi:pentatricopeptide repeat protein